jgi:hypothetical protein
LRGLVNFIPQRAHVVEKCSSHECRIRVSRADCSLLPHVENKSMSAKYECRMQRTKSGRCAALKFRVSYQISALFVGMLDRCYSDKEALTKVMHYRSAAEPVSHGLSDHEDQLCSVVTGRPLSSSQGAGEALGRPPICIWDTCILHLELRQPTLFALSPAGEHRSNVKRSPRPSVYRV